MRRSARVMVAAGMTMVLASSAGASSLLLDHFNNDMWLVASEPFTGYGVGPVGTAPDGPTLNGNGAGLGTGFSGNWSGNNLFLSDDAYVGSAGGSQPPSGFPLVVESATSQSGQVVRALSVGIGAPGSEYVEAEFMLSWYGTSTSSGGRHGHGIALLDESGNMLCGISFDGNGGAPVGRFRMYGPAGPDAGAPDDPAPEKNWHHIVMRGVWEVDGTLNLYSYIDPDASTLLSDYGTTISTTITADIMQIQVRAGDFNGAGGAMWDDIELRVLTVVPEPGVAALLSVFGLGLLRRRGKHGPVISNDNVSGRGPRWG